jgi:uncharacterized protein (UPF0332 family)
MDRINWCISQRAGIELVEPSENLRKAYLIKADEALTVLKDTNLRDWKITTAYYAMYHGLYSILMRIGIKCEIHTCTIEFAKIFLNKYLSREDLSLLGVAFRSRNNAQYYVDRAVGDEEYNLIIKKAPMFLVKCKNIIILEKEILELRSKLSGKIQKE